MPPLPNGAAFSVGATPAAQAGSHLERQIAAGSLRKLPGESIPAQGSLVPALSTDILAVPPRDGSQALGGEGENNEGMCCLWSTEVISSILLLVCHRCDTCPRQMPKWNRCFRSY